MLKEAIRFHYSWQPNFLTTDMIVSLVGSYVGHAMIFHKKLRRMLAMKCRNLSMNHRKVISWILRQPIIVADDIVADIASNTTMFPFLHIFNARKKVSF